MKILIFLSALVLIVSCKDTKEELLNLNEIAPTSDNYKEGKKIKETEDTSVEKVETLLDQQKLEEQQLHLKSLRSTDTLLFPDRFSAQSSRRFYYSIENDSVLYSKWKFKDSLKTKNVFLNWSNCFGTRCKSASIGEKVNLQGQGFLLLSNDTCLIYIATNSSSEQKKWINYFTSEEDIQWRYILTQPKSGKVTWRSYFEEKFIELTPNIQEYAPFN